MTDDDFGVGQASCRYRSLTSELATTSTTALAGTSYFASYSSPTVTEVAPGSHARDLADVDAEDLDRGAGVDADRRVELGGELLRVGAAEQEVRADADDDGEHDDPDDAPG